MARSFVLQYPVYGQSPLDLRDGNWSTESYCIRFPICVWRFDVHYVSQNAELAMATYCTLLDQFVDSNRSCFSQSLRAWHTKMSSHW